MTEPQDHNCCFWERTDRGALLLKRDGHTIALVIRLDDRRTYGWLHYGERSEPFPTEQAACDALLDRIEARQWHHHKPSPTERESISQ